MSDVFLGESCDSRISYSQDTFISCDDFIGLEADSGRGSSLGAAVWSLTIGRRPELGRLVVAASQPIKASITWYAMHDFDERVANTRGRRSILNYVHGNLKT